MYRLRARLAETLMSTGDQGYTGIFTAYQTDFATVVECRCCGFRRYCSILWRCLIHRLCRILVYAVVIVIGVSPKMLIQRCGVGAHVMTHGVQELHPCIRVAVIAIDAGFDESLFQRAERVAYLRVQIAHSCIVHSRKFSVPEAILSNGTRKLLWFENTEMLTALEKINLLCYLSVHFRSLLVAAKRGRLVLSEFSTHVFQGGCWRCCRQTGIQFSSVRVVWTDIFLSSDCLYGRYAASVHT